MAEIDVFKAQLVRSDAAVPWGFRLHRGGPDNQLLITRLTPGSPGQRLGLKSGDAVTEIMNRSTRHMGERDAMNMLNQNNKSVVLTVERRVGGESASPDMAPSPQAETPDFDTYYSEPNSESYNHINHTGYAEPQSYGPPPPGHYYGARAVPGGTEYGQSDQPRPYQTYDMTGKVAQPYRPQVHPNVRLQQVLSRPFDKPKNPYASPPPPPPEPEPEYIASPSLSPPPSDHIHMIPEEDKLHLEWPQSRTFKIIESVMQNNEPSGPSRLPPPRSATMERARAEGRDGKSSSPRVKVFMAQQYNNPMGLYHPKNVMETFATQANACMEDMERRAAEENAALMHSNMAQQPVYQHAYNGT